MGCPYLPKEIEEKIAKDHLVTFTQLAAFSAVCTSWRSIAHDLHCHCSIPGILVSKTSCPRKNCCERDPGCIDCLSGVPHRLCRIHCNPHHQFRPISAIFTSTGSRFPTPSKACGTRRRMHLRNRGEGGRGDGQSPAVDLEKCHCIASKDGWLVLVQPRGDCYPVRIYLLNPVTGASILLPSLKYDGYRPRAKLSHVILSSSPEKHDCHLVGLFGSNDYYDTPQVAWCKVNGGRWEYTRNDSEFFNVVECSCYIAGRFYVVDREKSVHVFDNLFNGVGRPTVRSFALPDLGDEGRTWTSYYAMELNGQLIVVVRYYQGDVVMFRVYKLEHDNTNWIEVRSLDGHAMFLGTHQSFCVRVQDDGTIIGDRIYFLNNSCGQCVLEGAHNRDVHKHLNKKKKKAQKSKERHKIDDNGFELRSSSKLTDHSRLLQRLASNRITPCHNSFEALLSGD
ncbi:hypothetical protein LINGRAHAP2_LOCUS13411 [Linum grandiflorum]